MLKTIGVDPAVTDPVTVSKNSTIDEVGKSEVNRTKIGTKTVIFKS